MKCWICGAEMVNTIGGCYECQNCHMAGINDGVLRYPGHLIKVSDRPVEEMPAEVISGSTTNSGASEDVLREIDKHDQKLLQSLSKEFGKFVENYRRDLFGLAVAPEISAIKARELDLQIFNDLAGDFLDTLQAYLDGPPCEGWDDGSLCRTCTMEDCPSNRVYSKLFGSKTFKKKDV